MDNVPKISELQDDMKKAPTRRIEIEAKGQMTHLFNQIRAMAADGYTAIHTEEIKRLQEKAPHIGAEALSALSDQGFTIVVTQLGHQIEWPDVEREPEEPSQPDAD